MSKVSLPNYKLSMYDLQFNLFISFYLKLGPITILHVYFTMNAFTKFYIEPRQLLYSQMNYNISITIDDDLKWLV